MYYIVRNKDILLVVLQNKSLYINLIKLAFHFINFEMVRWKCDIHLNTYFFILILPSFLNYTIDNINLLLCYYLLCYYLFTEGKKVRTLLALNLLFIVVTTLKKKKEQWRPSRQESREAFLLFVKVCIF